jgi:hypothetical protein
MSGSDGFSVNLSSLISQAGTWNSQADQMRTVIQQIATVDQVGHADGVFAPVARQYNTACAQVSLWCCQGEMQMLAIASALQKAKWSYQSADDWSTHQLADEKLKIDHSNRIHDLINGVTRRPT